jgi:lysyl-tRNA synthetase class II
MTSTEELVRFAKAHIDRKLGKAATEVVSFDGKEIDLSGNWHRFSVRELLKKYLNVQLEDIVSVEQIVKFAKEQGVNVAETDDWQTVFEMLFADKIEPSLPTDKPMFIYDYPKLLCPLTREKPGDPLVCEKVELYMAGREIANGYTELLDADEQERRFLAEQKARVELGKKAIAFDHDLVEALRSGLPPVAGIGMGLDRLAMILADARSISEVNYFPGSELFD